jgi:tripartite-type tricarboxylate transporter receptor subunit TctC
MAAAKPTATPTASPTAALQASPMAAPVAAGAWRPSRPDTLICPWAAGGGTDRVARTAAMLLEKDVGQPINAVNRTGGGAVGHTTGATADPDGHTITTVTVEIAMIHWIGLAQVTPRSFAPAAQSTSTRPASR